MESASPAAPPGPHKTMRARPLDGAGDRRDRAYGRSHPHRARHCHAQSPRVLLAWLASGDHLRPRVDVASSTLRTLALLQGRHRASLRAFVRIPGVMDL